MPAHSAPALAPSRSLALQQPQQLQRSRRNKARTLRSRCVALQLKRNDPTGGYKGIVFKGGGVKGMAYVGALQALEDEGVTTASIECLAGSSAGSIVAAMVAAGMTPSEMKKELYGIDWSKVKDGSDIFVFNVLRLVRKYGLYSSEYLEDDVVEKLLYERTGVRRITFEQLNKLTGKCLRVTATNLTNKELEIFDHVLTPNMPVSKAVQISSNVPIFFKPVEYNDKYYVDGGTLRNLDLTAFVNIIEPPEKALAMDLEDKSSLEPDKITNVVQFFLALILTLAKYANLYDYTKPDNVEIVGIDTTNFNALNFDITKEQQEELYRRGYNAVKKNLSPAVQELASTP